MELSDLNQLDHEQKEDLIRSLSTRVVELETQISEKDGLVQSLSTRVVELETKVSELEERLALNSRNSSKPPSSDGYSKPAPKPKSLRVPGKNPTGGQTDHPGHTLEKSAHPDHIIAHEPPVICEVCGAALPRGTVVETRQVFDLPPIRYEVTEHQVVATTCSCGQCYRGEFPYGVNAPVQYGPQVKATVVHLSQQQMLPAQRTADVMNNLFDLPMSDATVLAAVKEAGELLNSTVEVIAQAVVASPVVNADETGLRVAGKLQWVHVLATTLLTWIGIHPQRGKVAFDAFGLLDAFIGILVHDGWKPYWDLKCLHALCNAHHLRELTYLFEEMEQQWARRLIEMLVAACHEVATGIPLTTERIEYFRALYLKIIAEGEAANPRAPPSGKRGRTRQSKAVNLLERLRTHIDAVLRFTNTPNVPFTNNLAELIMRMIKVKQKVSGCFRTFEGAQSFCTIRSYLDTMSKQGDDPFLALVQTFQGNVPQPRLLP